MDKAHTDKTGSYKARFEVVFARSNVTIIVGDKPAGKSYETTADGKTLYLNLTLVNSPDTNLLQEKLTDAVMAMYTPKAEIE